MSSGESGHSSCHGGQKRSSPNKRQEKPLLGFSGPTVQGEATESAVEKKAKVTDTRTSANTPDATVKNAAREVGVTGFWNSKGDLVSDTDEEDYTLYEAMNHFNFEVC